MSGAIGIAREIGASPPSAIAAQAAEEANPRREAERRKLHAIGTLGVLQAASRKKLLDLRKALELLRSTSFYITEELLERLMAETKE
jgi:predicted nucleic acid-binding protein